MGGVFGGARWIGWSRGWLVVRRNPCRLVRHRRGDVCGRRRAFMKGVGFAPSPAILYIPGETLGFVWAAASLASQSFLMVLLGMRRFGVLGVWWNSLVGAAVVGLHRFR